jgi:hypothetical protein
MSYPEYQADLNRLYESEVFGELLFATAARLSGAGTHRDSWLLLRDLETQTKDRLLAFLSTSGQQARLPTLVRAKGVLVGTLLGVLPWSLAMKLLEDGTAPFLAVFERLERNAPESARAFFAYVVAHERAIAEFARRERAGDAAATAPVRTLLA